MANSTLKPPNQRLSSYLDLLQRVLVVTRYLAGEELEHKRLYMILDQIELLPSLLITASDEHLSLFAELVEGLQKYHEMFADTAERARRLRT